MLKKFNKYASDLKEVYGVIVLKDISKSLQGKRILSDISFHIAPNESVGLIGLNGAGKTTLLNVMAGLLKPDSGFLRMDGAEMLLEEKEKLKGVAYVSGLKSQLWEDIRIRDSLSHCGRMYGFTEVEIEKRIVDLDKVFEIHDFMDALPKSLSLGERMRCELLYALLARPRILMLDEAMIGLDVSMKYKIEEYFRWLKNEKVMTMLYTSHNLAEVERICDRILLIDHGKILFDGAIDRLLQEFSPLYRMEIVVENGGVPDFEDLPVERIYIEHKKILIVYDKKKIDSAFILSHVLEQFKVLDVKIFEPDLETTIKKIYERDA